MTSGSRKGSGTHRGAPARGGSDDRLRMALRQFVRTRGEQYLRDANVSSIGVGYKVTDGEVTPQLAIQFTVDSKASSPEALEAMDTTPLPDVIEVGGTEVPTDVLERSFAPGFKIVAQPEAVGRKT
jgi:endonuclease G